MPSQKSSQPPKTWTGTLTIVAVGLALFSALFYFLDSHLDWFYILNPSDLHDLSLRAIDAHGNDTRSVVGFIAGELSEKLPGGYVNLDEEWIFNNAGGAMGAMWILHASEFLLQQVDARRGPNHMTYINANSIIQASQNISLFLVRGSPQSQSQS